MLKWETVNCEEFACTTQGPIRLDRFESDLVKSFSIRRLGDSGIWHIVYTLNFSKREVRNDPWQHLFASDGETSEQRAKEIILKFANVAFRPAPYTTPYAFSLDSEQKGVIGQMPKDFAEKAIELGKVKYGVEIDPITCSNLSSQIKILKPENGPNEVYQDDGIPLSE